MANLIRLLRRGRRRERGQVLVLFAAGLVTFAALLGLAVDVGQVVHTRTDLQKTADAAALAAAQDLPDQDAANATAMDYVARNGPDDVTANIQFTQGSSAVTVQVEREVEYIFIRLVGLAGTDVDARATVRVGSYSGGTGLVPWGLIASNDSESTLLQNDCYTGLAANGNPTFQQNTPCRLKSGAGTNSGGDFGALALDGPGASTYRDSIANGSDSFFQRGDKVQPQTGNAVGPTRQGLEDRFAKSAPPGCPGNGRNQVLIDNADGTVSIRPGCENSARVVIIPVVDRIDNPHDSTIVGFAFMYMTGLQHEGGGEGHSEVHGEFVEFVSDLPGAEYNATGPGASALTLSE